MALHRSEAMTFDLQCAPSSTNLNARNGGKRHKRRNACMAAVQYWQVPPQLRVPHRASHEPGGSQLNLELGVLR
eukprot:scaffold160654_cov23-Tisochrysis_lutea.AAC.2